MERYGFVPRIKYTAEDLHALSGELPGFVEPANVYDIFANYGHSLWQPVLSATIISQVGDELCVARAIRTPEGNENHADILSTPTMRVPLEAAGALVAEEVPFCLNGVIDPTKPFVSEAWEPSVATLPNSADVLADKVGHLLSHKLGMADTLETARRPVGRASLARCVVGFSYLDDTADGEPLYEPLIMISAIVGLDSEIAKSIPEKTRSYSSIGWTSLDAYIRGVRTRSILDIMPEACPEDELGVCVRGLCNITSVEIARGVAEINRHLTEEGVMESLW